jgi:hypothetical protein
MKPNPNRSTTLDIRKYKTLKAKKERELLEREIEKLRRKLRSNFYETDKPQTTHLKLSVPPKTEEVLKNIDLSSAKLHKTDDITKNFKLIKIQRPGSSKEEVLVKKVNLPPAKGYYITEQKPRNLPILKPKETPYKETVAREGFKTAEMLENLLKGGQSKVVETKETVLKPIENLKKLSKEIPEEAKNDPEIRRRFIEIIKDVKKISGRARFENVSDDLRALDAKVNELNDLLKKYSNKGRKKQTKKGQSNK